MRSIFVTVPHLIVFSNNSAVIHKHTDILSKNLVKAKGFPMLTNLTVMFFSFFLSFIPVCSSRLCAVLDVVVVVVMCVYML